MGGYCVLSSPIHYKARKERKYLIQGSKRKAVYDIIGKHRIKIPYQSKVRLSPGWTWIVSGT